MTAARFSVLIVGAGPVGLTLANLLGIAGVDALLIEANDSTSDTPKAILIDDESLRTFDAIGLAEAICQSVVHGTGARYYTGAGRLIAAVRPMEGAYGHPKRSAFGQPALERILLRGVERHASVDVRFGTRLTAIASHPEGERATIADARQTNEVVVDWIVGCDGGRSTVRELSGIAMTGDSFAERWLIVDTADDPDDSRFTKFMCDAARPAVSVPAPQGGRRYEFMLLPGEDPSAMLTPSSIAALTAPYRRLTADGIVRQTVYTFHALTAERFRSGRRLLLGDAAHMMPPFAGQGMNSGIRDADNVAWKLRLCVAGLAGPDLLDTYEVERRPHVEAMIALSVTLGRLVMSTSPLKAWLRDAAFRALSLVPSAKQWVATMRWKPAPRYSAGCLVGPVARSVGTMLPQPLVNVGEGPPVRLDRRLGPGFSLICGDRAVLDALRNPLWDRIGARRLTILTGDRTPRREDEVGDRGDVLARFLSRHRGEVLLIRPDRYVAGAFGLADEALFAKRVAALLRTTGRPAADARFDLAA